MGTSGLGAAPALGIRHFPGDGDGPRLGWAVGPQVGPAWWSPWPGRAGLWGAGDWPCCGDAGTGTDGPREADMGSWALRALTIN